MVHSSAIVFLFKVLKFKSIANKSSPLCAEVFLADFPKGPLGSGQLKSICCH